MKCLRLLKIASRKLSTLVSKMEDAELTRNHIDALVNNKDWASGYANEREEVLAAIAYREQIQGGLDRTPSESGKLYREVIQTVSSLIEKSHRIRTVFNFGVSYAWVDSELARKFPHVQFVGIDRSPLTKAINDAYFHLPNLHILSGDVLQELPLAGQFDFRGGVFMHIRTGTLLPRGVMENLYSLVSSLGFGHVALFEQTGISRQTNRPYEFSSHEDRESVVYRGSMQIHNYPWLLKQAGFDGEWELIKTAHPHKDFRIVKVVANKG